MKKGIDYVGIVVMPLLHDGSGKYLFEFRGSKSQDEQACWSPVGAGGLEHGESMEEALKREVKEELATKAFNIEYLGFEEVFREIEGAKSHWLRFNFKAEINPEKVINCEPHKIEKLQWFNLNELPQPTHSQWSVVYEKYKHVLK